MSQINRQFRTPPPSGMKWSPQQEEAFEWVRSGSGNAVLEAVAGSGKTTTLVEICRIASGAVVFTAYNKKIADEIGLKLQRSGASRSVTSATFHSLGFRAWRSIEPKVKVEGRKLDELMNALQVPRKMQSFVSTLVSLAKQRGIGIPEIESADSDLPWIDTVEHFDLEEKIQTEWGMPSERTIAEGIEWARKVLQRSIQVTDTIDFDDMIYMPLLLGAKIDQYDWVLVDEAQDTNPTRRELAKRMLKPSGRLIAVGDRHQAIYGFTGADSDALDLIVQQLGATTLPLTVTYRCPKSVVQLAQRWVHHIEAHESAPQGVVRNISDSEFRRITPEATDAILCRNTKPLVQIAFDLIKRRIPCHVEGREIGQSLTNLVKRFPTPTVDALQRELEQYLWEEEGRLISQNKEAKAAQLRDKVETLFVMIETLRHNDPVSRLTDLIESLFADGQANVTLSTVHKAKGREWDRVYLYGRDRFMPSKFAKQDWQLGQENNLIYVAVTRAKKELIEVNTQPTFEQPLKLGEGITVVELDGSGEALVKAHDAVAEAVGEPAMKIRDCIPPEEFIAGALLETPQEKLARAGITPEEMAVLLTWMEFSGFELKETTQFTITMRRKP